MRLRTELCCTGFHSAVDASKGVTMMEGSVLTHEDQKQRCDPWVCQVEDVRRARVTQDPRFVVTSHSSFLLMKIVGVWVLWILLLVQDFPNVLGSPLGNPRSALTSTNHKNENLSQATQQLYVTLCV